MRQRLKLGLWIALALVLCRAAVLLGLGLGEATDSMHVQLRVTALLPGIVALAAAAALGVAGVAALIDRAHGMLLVWRSVRSLAWLAAAGLFLWILAGWSESDSLGQVGFFTARGRGVLWALGALALVLAAVPLLWPVRASTAGARTSLASLLVPAALIVALPATWCGLVRALHPESHPNIVLIVIDTLRADMLLDPEDEVESPNLDALARDGIEYTQAFSHAPFTLPSHVALLTSRPPHRSRVLANGQQLPRDLLLFPDWIRRHGYATRAVVSIGTLRPLAPARALDRVFDEFAVAMPFVRRAHESQPDMLSALERLPENRPFFLFAHYADPHTPYCAYDGTPSEADVRLDGNLLCTLATSTSGYFDGEVELEAGGSVLEIESSEPIDPRFVRLMIGGERIALAEPVVLADGRRFRYVLPCDTEQSVRGRLRLWLSDRPNETESVERYRAEVEYADEFVGALIDALKAKGIYDETLIVMTSDHGEGLGERDGLFGHGLNVFDEALHVPLIIKPPSGHPLAPLLGERAARIARHMDVIPTMLELSGLPELPGQLGTSLADDIERVHLAETHPHARPAVLCVRDERFKLVYIPSDDRFEMYDLRDDPAELHDVYATSGSQREAWTSLLREAERLGNAADELLAEPPDAETADMLQALGYLGDG